MSTAAIMTDICWPPRRPLRDFALRGLGELLFWLVMLQLVGGAYLQSQLALFDGRIAVSNGAPKLLLVFGVVLLAAGAVWLSRGRIAWRPCLLPAGIFACYLAADLAWLTATSGVPVEALLLGLNKYFLFFAAVPAAALLRPRISAEQMNLRLVLLFVPLVLVALAQFAMNDPLLRIAAEDGTYEVPAVEFYGQIRAFSLFRGVLECGQAMAFFGALFLAQLCSDRPRHRLWYLALLALAAVGCLVTFRRGAYIEFGAAAVSAIAIARRWHVSRWLPWMYLAVGLGLAGVGTMLGSTQGEGVLSAESLAERHGAWNLALDKWLVREDASLLFGTGLAQIESDTIEYFLVDNGFLAVGVQLGLVGLALWCWVMQALWRDMLATASRTHSALAIAVAALLSTWMMRDVFDPLFMLYPLYVFLVFWSQPDAEHASSASPPARQGALCA